MKKTIFLFLILIQSAFLLAQDLETVNQDKATVYFTRANSMGALINFTYFDGEQTIGRFKGPMYLKYECQPGKHLFWARSENKSFVEADLKAGQIYIIDVIPRMGGFKASVKLVPVDIKDYKMKRIQKLLSKRESESFDKATLDELQTDMAEVIVRGMEKYKELKEKDKEIAQLSPDMTVTPQDLILVKKQKK